MNRIFIKDFSGKIIGSIEILPNGDKVVRDYLCKILGRYEKSTNTTKDYYGKIIARGDCCSLLLSTK
ncbi:MAG: hypothetical protein IJZ04_04170 [Clostridia bacterium]|nr:hypothetical protein [Clostridia bacterium]